jgi:NH3-dependent NAD+ synthetase
VARYLGLPGEIIRQRPSPGFGGIYDEEILGPYELLDQILAGFDLRYPNDKIGRWVASRGRGIGSAEAGRYIRFLRVLSRYAAQK